MATPSTQPMALTGDEAIDAATNGYYWALDQSRTIRWSLSNGLSGEAWANPSAAASSFATALSTFSYYANINFQYAGYFSSPQAASSFSDINISLDAANLAFSSPSTLAIGFPPGLYYNNWRYIGSAGDVYFNLNSIAARLPSYAPGSYGFALALHELGHTLGLKHPHDDGGTGRPTFESLGISWLDIESFSVMSYNETYAWNLLSWSPASPMIWDVIALQALYGLNQSTNAGNSTFTLSETGQYQTYWDAGGSDIVSAAGSWAGWTIQLPDIQISTIVDTKAGYARPTSYAGSLPTTLYWLAGDIESAIGSSGADTIYGSSLNNGFIGGAGSDWIDGGAGTDHAYYSSQRSNYAITNGSSSITIQDRTFRDGTDTVQNIERVHFSDKSIAFDIEGSAGRMFRLYQAAFDRTPDLQGLGYWINSLDVGYTMRNVASGFYNSTEFKTLYGQNPSNFDFLTKLYNNVLHRAPDQSGFNWWLNVLNRGLAPQEQLLIDFSDSAENRAQVIGSIQNGIEYTPWAG
jgi:hypothetical protein